jgi:hypothetical protein
MTVKIATPYRPISLNVHSTLDWLFVMIGAAGPFALGYWQELLPTAYTYAAVAIGVGLNAITAYPGGIAKLLPMRWHQFVEWTSPGPFIVGPWFVLADYPAAKWLLIGIGVAVVLNTALTQKSRAPVAG